MLMRPKRFSAAAMRFYVLVLSWVVATWAIASRPQQSTVKARTISAGVTLSRGLCSRFIHALILGCCGARRHEPVDSHRSAYQRRSLRSPPPFPDPAAMVARSPWKGARRTCSSIRLDDTRGLATAFIKKCPSAQRERAQQVFFS